MNYYFHYNLFIFLSYCIYLFQCGDAIAINYQLIKNNYYITASSNKILFNDESIRIDLQSSFSYFINKNTSESNEIIEDNLHGKNIKFYLETDKFILKDDLRKYTFNMEYLVPISSSLYQIEALGLGINSKDKNINLIYSLYSSSIINKLTMLLSPEKNSKGKIFFGNYDPEVAISKKYLNNYFECNSSNNNWGCIVNKIQIGNLTVLSEPTYFLLSTIHTGMIVPNEMMIYLNQTYFQKYIQNGDCHLVWGEHEKYFSCYCSAVYNFPEIYFYVNNYKIKFNPKYYFYSFIDSCYLNFVGENGNDGKYILGAIFLQSFYTEFNYEENKVKFYSDNPIIKESNTNSTITYGYNNSKKEHSFIIGNNKSLFGINYEIYFKISISINIILMILGIFYIFLVKNKQNEE